MDNNSLKEIVKNISAISPQGEEIVLISIKDTPDNFSVATALNDYLKRNLPERKIIVVVGDIETKVLTRQEKLRLLEKIID